MKKIIGLFAIGICVLVSMPARAALLGTYDFPTETTVPTVANGTFTAFARQNVTASAQTGVFNSSGWNTSGTLDTTEYVQFTIAPSSGHNVTISDLAFTYLSSKSSGSNPGGPTSIIVSVFAGTLGAGSGNGNTALATTTITASADDKSHSVTWDFADQLSASGFTFRFYGLNAESAPGTLSFDAVTLNGLIATAVPEPINYAMAILGLAFVGTGVGRFYLGKSRQTA